MDIKSAVFEALQNAVENGYNEVLTGNATAVAEDLIANNSEIELMLGLQDSSPSLKATPKQLNAVKEMVETWQMLNRN